MKIFKLTAENVKKIKAVDLTPDGNMVVVEGKNANGKTSLLDCIAYALGGKKLLPEEPIRHGEEGASITLDIGNYTVTRWWTDNKKSYLKVESKDGMKASSPQKMLDDLIGDMSFDPMEFCNLDGAKRSEILKRVSGLNLDDLEAEYKKTFEERTMMNRDVKQSQSAWERFKDVEDPGEVPSTSDLIAEKSKADAHNMRVKSAISGYEGNLKRIDWLKSELERLHKEMNELVSSNHELKLIADEGFQSTEHIESMIAKADKLREQKRDYHLAQDHKKDYETHLKLSENLSKKLEAIKQEKALRLAQAKLPIPGLDFHGGDISFNGVEFSQISTAQRIKVSMAIAMALNPKIKIIRILNGSLLDGDAMKEIEALAKEHDFQVWIERVSDAPTGNAIYIEDGEVKTIQQPAHAEIDF